MPPSPACVPARALAVGLAAVSLARCGVADPPDRSGRRLRPAPLSTSPRRRPGSTTGHDRHRRDDVAATNASGPAVACSAASTCPGRSRCCRTAAPRERAQHRGGAPRPRARAGGRAARRGQLPIERTSRRGRPARARGAEGLRGQPGVLRLLLDRQRQPDRRGAVARRPPRRAAGHLRRNPDAATTTTVAGSRSGPTATSTSAPARPGTRPSRRTSSRSAARSCASRPRETRPGNPFGGSPIWSYGHRNVQGLAWDSAGRCGRASSAPNTWDELNLIEPGSNYGWPEVEGHAGQRRLRRPVAQWPTAEMSPSGIAMGPDGAVYMAALRGESVWRVPIHADGTVGEPERNLEGTYGRIRDVRFVGRSLWLTTSNGDRTTSSSRCPSPTWEPADLPRDRRGCRSLESASGARPLTRRWRACRSTTRSWTRCRIRQLAGQLGVDESEVRAGGRARRCPPCSAGCRPTPTTRPAPARSCTPWPITRRACRATSPTSTSTTARRSSATSSATTPTR